MLTDPRGAHAVVTGASRGIGHAIARDLAARGAIVTAVARDNAALDRLAALTGGHSLPVDLTDPDHVAGLIDRAERSVGTPVDILVNNAALMIAGPVSRATPDDIAASVALNVTAPLLLTQQALPGMLARDRGTVVNVSSLGGVTAMPQVATYGATKAALGLFTAALQRELRETAVHATVAELGEVAGTELMESIRENPRIAAMSVRLARLRAFGTLTPEHVAETIVDAALAGRASVVIPRRAAPLHHLQLLPTRITDAIFYRLREEPS